MSESIITEIKRKTRKEKYNKQNNIINPRVQYTYV